MMHQGNVESEGLDGIAGAFFFCPYELQVRIHPLGESSWGQEFRVEWTPSSPSSVFEPGQTSPGLTWHSLYTSCSFEQSRVPLLSPQAARNQENKISYWPSRVSWAAWGARSEAEHSARAACSILVLRVLVPFSSDTVAILHFWRLFQREENQWFKATKILEGFKKIFILSKAKWLRLIMSMHLYFRLSFHTSLTLHCPFGVFFTRSWRYEAQDWGTDPC